MAEEPAGPDPWRAVTEVLAAAEAERAADPALADELDRERAWFGGGGDSVADLLDELDRRAVIDVEAPIESSRPGVPQVKRLVRKANAFVARHMAEQITVLVGTLSTAVRRLDARVAALEHDDESLAHLLPMAPDHRPRFADVLQRLAHEGGGTRRDIGTPAELRALPAADAGLVVLWALPDVLDVAGRRRLLRTALAGVRAGGAVAIVVTDPAHWRQGAGPVLADLAPGRPLDSATWAHLCGEEGLGAVSVTEDGPAHLVVARR